MSEQLRTDQLEAGHRVRLPFGLLRTVLEVVPSPYVNYRDETIFNVLYAEGQTPEWGHGNSGTASSLWTVEGADS